MLLSYRWLCRHVDLTGITPEEVAEALTLSVAEVEGLEPFAPHLSAVTVGHVQHRERHPDADKLSVCTVDIGAEETLNIVCGAPNVDAGQRVAVATVGTVLPGDFKIKKSKIRGVASQGMICSVRELELGDEHDGIWVLPGDAAVGTPVAEALDMTDHVIEIDNKSVTHRPDLWGHRGFARELAAIFRRELKPLDTTLPAPGAGAPCPVRIEDGECSRYVAVAVDGVRAEPSPLWLRRLLLAVGQRPHDLLVDVSNFVMLDVGQPNHLFDRTRIGGDGIVVRKARAKETMQTLDGFERKLTPSDLLICSGDEPVALAGVMGGENSKVEGDTSRLLLEVATFDPAGVRRTASRLGLRTDSSARFEKSLDPTLPMAAAGHLVQLLREIQPGVEVSAPVTDVGDWTDPALMIDLRGARVRRLLGVDLDDDAIADILVRLGFGVERGSDAMRVSVPSARATKDITIEQDLVEEVGRIHRYGNVPERRLVVELDAPKRDERRELVRRIQDELAGGGRFREVLSYSFLSDEMVERLGLWDEAFIQVVNPVAEGLSRIRRSIVPSLLEQLEHNRRAAESFRLFEIGKGYRPEASRERGEPAEDHLLALALVAPRPAKGARFDESALLSLEGVVLELLQRLGRVAPSFDLDAAPPSWANPGRSLALFAPAAKGEDEGMRLGLLAELEPELGVRLGLTGELDADVALAELSIDAIAALDALGSPYTPIPRFPGVKVDVALALSDDRRAAEVDASIRQAAKGLAQDVELFDVYRGDSLGAGKRSLAYHVLLQSDARTLTDKDVAKFLDRLERSAREKLGGELRRQ